MKPRNGSHDFMQIMSVVVAVHDHRQTSAANTDIIFFVAVTICCYCYNVPSHLGAAGHKSNVNSPDESLTHDRLTDSLLLAEVNTGSRVSGSLHLPVSKGLHLKNLFRTRKTTCVTFLPQSRTHFSAVNFIKS